MNACLSVRQIQSKSATTEELCSECTKNVSIMKTLRNFLNLFKFLSQQLFTLIPVKPLSFI